MRPVTKGEAPREEYDPYGDAVDDLVNRIGHYCSYCEQVIKHVPEVEHVQPKSVEPGLEFKWSNFLLGCKSCNSVKSKSPVDPALAAFPDQDNTFVGLRFHPDGCIEVSPSLGPVETALMKAVVKLVKLHRHPSGLNRDDRPSKRDKRYAFRRDTWAVAQRQLKTYEEFLSDPVFSATLARQIAEVIAPQYGFFSIWVAVFADYPSMINRFISAFPGTAAACFDIDGMPVPRPGGRF